MNEQDKEKVPTRLMDTIPVDEHHEESLDESGQKVVHKGVYLLPNLFTAGAMFGGFFAIVSAINGHFDHAALAIYAAQVLDGFDGRVARMTKTESRFGVEFDSLSDMVSFGLAPAVVVYLWALQPLGNIGLAAAFVFTVCAAIRLARFNTQVNEADSNYFIGLASPPAATLIASGVWLGSALEATLGLSILVAILVASVGFLMVSNIRYLSFKGLDRNRRVPFITLLIVFLVFVAVTIEPPLVLFSLAFLYMSSGPLRYGYLLGRRLFSR